MTLILLANLSTPAHAIVPSRTQLETVALGDETWQTVEDVPECEEEAGEIEIGAIGSPDGSCEVISYLGLTEDCDLYSRTELVCAEVIFEGYEE